MKLVMKSETVHRFYKFTPPATCGPVVCVARADIVAVENAYDPLGNMDRAALHLRGGSTLMVSESFERVCADVYSRPQPVEEHGVDELGRY